MQKQPKYTFTFCLATLNSEFPLSGFGIFVVGNKILLFKRVACPIITLRGISSGAQPDQYHQPVALDLSEAGKNTLPGIRRPRFMRFLQIPEDGVFQIEINVIYHHVIIRWHCRQIHC
jgi:hypothetical protein